MAKLIFEKVEVKGTGEYFKRAKVANGWIVIATNPVAEYQERHTEKYGFRSSIVFVPDQSHIWGKEESNG